jgi:hypothetical protein
VDKQAFGVQVPVFHFLEDKPGEDAARGRVGYYEQVNGTPVFVPGFNVEKQAAGLLVNDNSDARTRTKRRKLDAENRARELGPQAAGYDALDWDPSTAGPSFLPSPEASELPGPRIENIEPESPAPKGGAPAGGLEGMGASLDPILAKLGTFSEQSRDAAKAQSDAAKEQKDVAAIWKQVAQEMQRGQGAMRH